MLHHRIKHIGDYMYPKHKKEEEEEEEIALINKGIEELYEKYLKFKSVQHVLDPTYATLHKTAVQDARDAGVIQTPATSSKDTLPKPKAKATGRPINLLSQSQLNIRAKEEKEAEKLRKKEAKGKGKGNKLVAKTD